MPSDDPFCHTEILPNGTTMITYTGLASAWSSPLAPCIGTNLRSVNILILVIGILACFTCIYLTHKLLFSRRKTFYSITMMTLSCIALTGLVIDLAGAATFYQMGGYPNVTHLPKLFYYLSGTGVILVEGVRFDFVLILFAKPRSWTRRILVGYVIIASILFTIALAVFFVGARNGHESVGITYVLPYMIWYIVIGLTDVALSVMILHLSYNQTRIIRSYDTLTVAQVQQFTRQCMIICGGHVIVVLAIFVLFNLSSGVEGLGYTCGVLATIAIPFQNIMLVFSIYALQKIEALKNRRPTVAGSSKGDVSAVGNGEAKTVKNVMNASAKKLLRVSTWRSPVEDESVRGSVERAAALGLSPSPNESRSSNQHGGAVVLVI